MARRLCELQAELGSIELKVRVLEDGITRLERQRAATSDVDALDAIDQAIADLRAALRRRTADQLTLELAIHDHPDADRRPAPEPAPAATDES